MTTQPIFLSLAIPLFVGFITFVVYKILGIAKQLNDLHDWHDHSDTHGRFVWYAQDWFEFYKSLNEHVEREMTALARVQEKVDHIYIRQSELVARGEQIEKLHSKLGTVGMNVQSLESYIKARYGEKTIGE